jgi:hypothetical protein
MPLHYPLLNIRVHVANERVNSNQHGGQEAVPRFLALPLPGSSQVPTDPRRAPVVARPLPVELPACRANVRCAAGCWLNPRISCNCQPLSASRRPARMVVAGDVVPEHRGASPDEASGVVGKPPDADAPLVVRHACEHTAGESVHQEYTSVKSSTYQNHEAAEELKSFTLASPVMC